jgi:hypothetical protein
LRGSLQASDDGLAVRRATPLFDIQIQFTGVVPPAYQQAFAAAESVWETLLPGFAPGILPKPLVINASFPFIDGVGGVLGMVSSCCCWFVVVIEEKSLLRVYVGGCLWRFHTRVAGGAVESASRDCEFGQDVFAADVWQDDV